MRTLYLQSRLSIDGRNSLRGRVLYDHFKRLSADSLLAHAVLPDDEVNRCDAKIRDDLLPFSLCDKFSPTLIYLEGGLFLDNRGTWRIPREKAEGIVAAGAVMVVADCDPNRVRASQDHYDHAKTFLRATIKYRGDGTDEVYLADLQCNWHGHRTIVCKPAEMVISDWLRPIYEGIGEIVVGSPSALGWCHDILASGNKATTGTMCLDTWIDRV